MTGLLTLVAGSVQSGYLFSDRLWVADCYLLVMLLWVKRFEANVPLS